jgi:hypothetical protein
MWIILKRNLIKISVRKLISVRFILLSPLEITKLIFYI